MPPPNFANNVRLHNDDQKTFVDTIKTYQSDTMVAGDDLKTIFRQDYPPFLFFTPAIISNVALIRKFTEFLLSRQITIEEHASHYVLSSLAITLYQNDDQVQALNAIDIFKEAISTRSVQQNASESTNAEDNSQPSPFQERSSFDKAAHHMAMRFKDDTKKFSGALGECWSEFISEYLYAAEDYKLNPFQKLQYFHHLLRDNAKRFYTRHIQGNVGSFSEASNLMEQEYNSISRRNRISNHLKSLRITQYVSSHCNTSDALEKLHVEISKLAPQGPMHYRSEEHRIEYLRSAVIGMSWAREPLSRVNAGGMSYQELFSQLESSIQQERDEKAALLQDSNYRRSGSQISDKVPGIFFNGQARYGRENTRKYSPANAIQSNGKECWNCGSPNHLLGGCTKQKDIANIAARKVQFYNKTRFDDEKKALKRVLYEICEQIGTDDTEADGYEDASTYFQECSMPEGEIPNDDNETTNGQTMEQLFNHPTESSQTEPSLTNCLSDF
jgi:hypothetical protein